MKTITLLSLTLFAPALFAQRADTDLNAVDPGYRTPTTVWGGAAAVLFDNGALQTGAGNGAGGSNTSQITAPDTTFGFGCNTASFRLADDFTIPAGQTWTIDSVTGFGYQTGSTTSSTFTAGVVRIWNGAPNVAGSAVVFGDATTNRLTSSSFTNIFRVTAAALTGSTRPIMANTVSVGTVLPSGTYWVELGFSGSLASGPFCPPVSNLNAAAQLGNALQLDAVAGTWATMVDAGSAQQKALPFIISGSAELPAPAPANATWAMIALGLALAGLGAFVLVRRG